jgi:signal transduction histidine kinase
MTAPLPDLGDAPSSESGFEPSSLDLASGALERGAWLGWRRRALAAVALLACLLLFAFTRWLAATPFIDAQWVARADGALLLQGSTLPELQGLQGRQLVALGDGHSTPRPVDALLLHRSPRWQVNDDARVLQVAQQEWLSHCLAGSTVELVLDGSPPVRLQAQLRGFGGLGLMIWPLVGLVLLLLLFGSVVVLARPQLRSAIFALMAFCQAGNLAFIALETMRGLGLPAGAATADMPARLALDLLTAAAIVQAFWRLSDRIAYARAAAAATWGVVAVVLLWALVGSPPLPWPLPWVLAQGLCLALGVLALVAVRLAHRAEPNPYAIVMRRFAAVGLFTLVMATAAVVVSARRPEMAYGVAVGASVAWYLFLASLLLLTPFLSRSRQVLREFALLAGISTVAASVDLLFAAVFSTSAFTSLALAVFIALAVYAGARQYLLLHLLGRSLLTTERTFELLYRAARDVQVRPQRYPQRQVQLLRELFEPLELTRADAKSARVRVVGGGAALLVPLSGAVIEVPQAVQLRFAQRGQRLFTQEDARLAQRVLEQLRRAVAYDDAVERGRHEERQRIAQDLHDDIGARLLTLMYQSPSKEMEDYIRHTLQDLKTLTRGLAATEHQLSHAAAEWKADLTQRLQAAEGQLGWSVQFDQDLRLSVVQWSALTRVLRELVTNALYHGHAGRIDVNMVLQGGALALCVVDDGQGRDPASWAHGLGMGGVRKRVKLLGGQVQWMERAPRGVVCEVQVPRFCDTGKRDASTGAPAPR